MRFRWHEPGQAGHRFSVQWHRPRYDGSEDVYIRRVATLADARALVRDASVVMPHHADWARWVIKKDRRIVERGTR